jgi:acyl transferase domain-containing protein
MADEKREFSGSEIAIVGMACRFPGASDIEQFWRNLVGGVESLSLLTDEELVQAGVPPELIAGTGYVRRASVLDGIEMFDPAFFGYTPLEARIMDPQHRLFLECAVSGGRVHGRQDEHLPVQPVLEP